MNPDALTIGQSLGRRPRVRDERDAVGHQSNAWAEERGNRVGLPRKEGWIEQSFLRLDLEIVRDVENVRDERDIDRRSLQLNVEVTERHRVCEGGPGDRENTDRKTHNAEATHRGQW